MKISAAALAVLAFAFDSSAQVPGACVMNDSAFQTQSGGCTDLVASRTWSAFAGNGAWNVATSYCNALVEGGFSDWRMPTLPELTALWQNGGATHLDYATWAGSRIWSSTTQGQKAYYLNLSMGQTGLSTKTSVYLVIAVRTPSSTLPEEAEAAATRAVVEVDQHAEAGARAISLHAPTMASAAFVVLSGVEASPLPTSIDLPLLVGSGGASAGDFTATAGVLDYRGRANLQLEGDPGKHGAPVDQQSGVRILIFAEASLR